MFKILSLSENEEMPNFGKFDSDSNINDGKQFKGRARLEKLFSLSMNPHLCSCHHYAEIQKYLKLCILLVEA